MQRGLQAEQADETKVNIFQVLNLSIINYENQKYLYLWRVFQFCIFL